MLSSFLLAGATREKKAQAERSAHLQARIPHCNIEVHVGMSVSDAVQAVASQRPR